MNGPFGYETLELTDVASTNAFVIGGSTVLDLLRPPYTLRSEDVDLGLSALRAGLLGGASPYREVPITLPLHISGATPALVYAALETLTALLEEAQAWQKDQHVGGVRLRGKLAGSSAPIAECVVLRPRDASPSMELPTIYQPPAGGPPGPYTMDVDLALVRRGQWLQPQESVSAAAAASGTLHTLTFSGTGRRILAPLRLAFQGSANLFGMGTGQADNQSALIWATDSTLPNAGAILPAANKIRILEAETFATGGVFSSVNDAANQARGSNVLRYTPAVASTFSTTLYAAASFGGTFNGSRIMVYGMARKNTLASVDYQAQLTGYGGTGTLPVTSPVQPLDLPDTRPNAVYLGTLLAPKFITNIALSLSASATGGSLDIDYLVLVNLDDPTAGAITYSLEGLDLLSNAGYTICVDPRPLTDPTGVIGATNIVGGRVLFPFQEALGDPWLAMQGTTVCCVLLQAHLTAWRAYDFTNAQLIVFTPTATRWPAGLTLT